jgi:hypothetical protein
MATASASEIHGVLAEFETPAALVHAANKAREAGYKDMDAYSRRSACRAPGCRC